MKKRGKRSSSTLWILLLVAVLALVAGYYVGARRGKKDQTPLHKEQSTPAGTGTPRVEAPIPPRQDAVPSGATGEGGESAEAGAECARLRDGIRDFFKYLNSKPYVQEIENGIDTLVWFKRIMAKLAAHPPVPSGESLDSVVMAGNVFHLFRHMEAKEIRLVREVLRNEATTLEMNLDLFYRWFTAGDRCPDPDGLRPPGDTLYRYAGFFLNTIGGRAYLFRRPGALRVLLSYYCLLILDEADRRGRNTHGIDLAPHVISLAREMDLHVGFLFQRQYVQKLDQLRKHYETRRQGAAAPEPT